MSGSRGVMRVLAVLALLVLGCSKGPEEPADPVWGKQACAHCAMLVTQKPPSAQLTLEDGSRRYFDDVGCMVAYLDREQVAPRRMWVRKGEGWVPPAEARYASGESTPMDFGFVAAEAGVSWEQVQVAVRARVRPPGGTP